VQASDDVELKYQTQESLEPDIWASVWLVSHALESQSNVLVEADPVTRQAYTSFGFEGADIFLPKESHFKHFLSVFNVEDPALLALGELVASVEKLGWQSQKNQDVATFESEFRSMQAQYGRYWVPVGCYKHFFDNQYAKLAGNEIESESSNCDREQFAGQISRPSIPTVAIQNVLQTIKSGKKVVFVDTRESSEFEERHIPGAVNMPFRQMGASNLDALRDADMVIPYCIKDFRGFEAARRLQENGIRNVSLLDPFGLAGWLEKDLPVAGTEGLEKSQANQALAECVQNNCLENKSSTL